MTTAKYFPTNNTDVRVHFGCAIRLDARFKNVWFLKVEIKKLLNVKV